MVTLGQRADIQVLRGTAVLAVVLFHGNESWFKNGYLGVDVFFVISGFVMTPILARVYLQETSREMFHGLRIFYRRRFYRLAPALGTTLVASTVLILGLGSVLDHERFAKQGLSTIFLLGNIGAYHYSGGDYFAPNPNPLIHMWSLSAEEQIYILLPLIIVMFGQLRKTKSQIFLRALFVIAGVAAYSIDAILLANPEFLQSFGITNVPQFLFYSPISRLWEFCIGSVIYFASLGFVKQKYRAIIFLAPTILILILFTPVMLNGFRSLLVCILTAFVLHYRILELLPAKTGAVMGWLGNRSYSIYLVHMPIIYIAHFSPLLTGVPDLFTTSLAILISIFCGSIQYQRIEQRFRIVAEVNEPGRKPLRTLIPAFVLVPICLFIAISVGVQSNYQQQNPNGEQPADMGLFDPNCERMNSSIPCAYPVSNPKGSAILIGDSHAGAMSQAFINSMKVAHYSAYVWTKGSCQPIRLKGLAPTEVRALRYEEELVLGSVSCEKHNSEIWLWLERHPEVIVFVNVRSSSNRPSEIPALVFRELLASNLVNLSKLTKKIIVIGPNPEFSDAVPYFSSPRLIWSLSVQYPKDSLLGKMDRNPFQDDRYYSQRFQNTKVDYQSITSLFCSSNSCSRWSNLGWLYRDGNHLSRLGAEKLSPLLTRLVQSNSDELPD